MKITRKDSSHIDLIINDKRVQTNHKTHREAIQQALDIREERPDAKIEIEVHEFITVE